LTRNNNYVRILFISILITMNVMAQEIKTVFELLRVDPKVIEEKSDGPVLSVVASHAKAEPAPNLPVGAVHLPEAPEAEEGQFVEKTVIQPAPKSFFQKDIVKYPLIFAVSFACFYLVLNYNAFSDKFAAYFKKPEAPKGQVTPEGQVLGVATPDYTVWISRYVYQVNDPDVLSPNADYDRDGLTNYQEFLLFTNPAKADTDNDGYSDGQEVLNGYNPLYEGKLSNKQQAVITSWDLREINSRQTYYALMKIGQGPAKPSSLPVINYDLEKSGELRIPTLDVKVPLLWSKAEKNFTADLENGVIHYPGTPLPGMGGTGYISGHSSNFIWSKSQYSHIFSRLDELKIGDEFFIAVPTVEGKRVNLRYVVFAKNLYSPDDQAQFESAEESAVNLSTCWPLGSMARRYVVSGKLAGM
jgi:LPXTG-site transpeptidase (sortase) family protein